jgi:stage V sporulation protein R
VPPLPAYLRDMQQEVEGYAKGFGLDFFPTIYEVLSYKQMNEVAAYGGFPTRYPHWRFGMDYEGLSKGYEYGLQKIYEMVINTNPAYAYLLEGNSLVDQKTVMAHVYAHVDFFKNNYFFAKTNRKMIDGMANHSTRVRKHIERQGIDRVETFIDTCLSLENLIDPMSQFINRKAKPRTLAEDMQTTGGENAEVPKLKAKSYMDPYINPPEFMEKQRARQKEKLEKEQRRGFPEEPQRDILLFLIEHAPLADWERDLLEIVRDEAYYFAPQGQTQIMNEGWASYWHSKIMTEKALRASEIIDYAEANAGVLATAPGQLNPYKLGVELYRFIEDRWNRGRFGKEWNECEDMAAKKGWDRRLGLGREKIFEVRKLYNDVTFIDEFFTLEFCHEQKFYSFGFNERSGNWEIETKEFKKVKDKLLFQLTNHGQPFIYVDDGNHENRGELLMRHRHEGVDLKLDHARDTLANTQRIWRRPVCLLTKIDGKGKLLKFDGRDHSEKSAEYPPR